VGSLFKGPEDADEVTGGFENRSDLLKIEIFETDTKKELAKGWGSYLE
jgi:hypothetical protein